ncbi:MAG: SDR family oxidoreductase [Gammaproteobacteria bacterium]|nr:SDR family oxidoreductase [Gammaproteobacteria bacterium]
MRRFENKTVLVTGAAGGIGSEICKVMAAEGANVIASDVNEPALLTVVAKLAAGNSHSNHNSIAGDIRDPQFCDALPGQAKSLAGSLDVVINNAGVNRRGTILATSDDDWTMTMQVNVDAIFRICRSTVPIMQQQSQDEHGLRGSIVNLASCWGLYPGPDHLAYCTSKAAVAAMTRCLGRDHAPDGIRVNAVCPNEVNTPMLRSGFELRGLNSETAIEELNQSVPLGRIAEPDDIAAAVAYLASNDARYVCGSLLEVNGGKPVY